MAERKSLEPWLKDEVVFYQHQVEGVRWMAKRTSTLLADDMGLGKAQPVTEPVLTPHGWTPIGQLRPGDQVISVDGSPVAVTGVFPQGEREIVRVSFSDGSWARCDWDHLWEVRTPTRKKRGAEPQALTIREIAEQGLTYSNGNRRWYVPMVAPVEFATGSESLPLDPYLVGVLNGDGSYTGCRPSTVALTTDTEIAESVTLPEGVRLRRNQATGGDPDYLYCGGFSAGLVPILKDLGMWGNRAATKHIPERYLYAQPAARIAVLQGLLDTDGTAVSSGRDGSATSSVEFGTVSKQLSEDVRFLVQSLGGTVSVKEKRGAFTVGGERRTGQMFYRMCLHLPSPVIPFRLQRKLDRWIPRSKYEPTRSIVSVESVGREDAVCISVDHPRQLYVTRDFVVTHNTMQSLAVFALDVIHNGATTAIVVCPSSLKLNWKAEIRSYTRFPVVVVPGAGAQPEVRARRIDEFEKMDGPRILVINYEQVKAYRRMLNRIKFDMAIFDEAHYLKNPDAVRTRQCRNLFSRRSLLLTGSPMPNNVGELWTLLDRCNPGQWGTYRQYLNQYAVFGGHKDKAIVASKNTEDLRAKLGQVMLRRMKKDVLDLPEVQYVDRVVGLSVRQEKLYRRVHDDMLLDLAEISEEAAPPPEKVKNAGVKFMRLLQICGTTATVSEIDHSEKLDLAVADAQELVENEHHVVVFTRWRKVQEAFVDRMRRTAPDVPVRVLSGDVPAEDVVSARTGEMLHPGRETVKNAWADDKPGVLVCMYQVAGVGLNMTKARHGLMLDQLFVPDLNQQAVDRLHRIGADRNQPVQIFNYFVAGTVEARIHKILQKKKKNSAEVLDAAAAMNSTNMMLAVMDSERTDREDDE